jgi:hypothetical protein
MMTPTEIEAAPAEAPVEKRGWGRLLLGIVLWPRSTFAYLREHGGRSWVLPVVLVALLAVAARAVAIPIEKAQADAAMISLRLRIFLMVFMVVVVAVGTVLVFASQGSAVAVQDFVGLSAARDQRVAVQLLSEPLRTGQAPQAQAQVQVVSQAPGARVLVIDQQGMVLADSINTLQGHAVPLPPQWSVVKQTAPLTVRDTPAFLVLGYTAATDTAGTSVGPGPLKDTLYFGPLAANSGSVNFSAAAPLVSLPGGVPAQLALDTINRSLLLAAVAAGGVALLLTATLSRGIVGPVEALTRRRGAWNRAT